jgi:predicted TIM-barrel fold metal-dependent hydrolase
MGGMHTGDGWVDAHVHIFPPELIERREGYLSRDERFAALYCSPRARMATADEVVAHMDECGVAQSIVFGFPFKDQGLCRMVNDYVLEAAATRSGRLAGLACVWPTGPGAVAELERCLNAGLRGCGELAPDDGPQDREGLAGVAAILRERGLPLLLHANEPVGHEYPGKSRFGPEACVAHMGGGAFLYEAMPELRPVLADAYYDTSAVPYLYDTGIYRAAEATAGAHKVLFGSDYALLSPARYREGLSGLCPDTRAAICGDNARKVFKL